MEKVMTEKYKYGPLVWNHIDDDDDFMFSSDKRSGTILESAFYIRVLLVGFSNDGQQQISLSTNCFQNSNKWSKHGKFS